MSSWRDELLEAVKSKTEKETEEEERRKKRLTEALSVADDAMNKALESLRFADEHFKGKNQPSKLQEKKDAYALELHELSLSVNLARDGAVVKVTFNDGRPREFDFAKDRHLSAKDVEEYVGRRAVELARAAQKNHPW
ncbi:MAG TPA: hypothetical protein VFB62_07335 [Polyangiaceae bacterium]|jgi:hypothetical protein|nr:hypothetical protein [Polyangiaceae bacterium]